MHVYYNNEKDNRTVAEKETVDNVNNPKHYQGKHGCIEEMIVLFGIEDVKAFCRCNVYKYRYRSEQKNGKQDIEKAEKYVDILKELESRDDHRYF